jgi:REP element-mobilizing transposase RayT
MIPLHPQPLRGFDYLGKYRYFITFGTYYRRPLFTSAEHVELARTPILRAAAQESFDLIAYCFMPDHVHLLVSGSLPVSDCRRFIARAKQFSGFYYQKEFHERLWQRYSYEHVVAVGIRLSLFGFQWLHHRSDSGESAIRLKPDPCHPWYPAEAGLYAMISP